MAAPHTLHCIPELQNVKDFAKISAKTNRPKGVLRAAFMGAKADFLCIKDLTFSNYVAFQHGWVPDVGRCAVKYGNGNVWQAKYGNGR